MIDTLIWAIPAAFIALLITHYMALKVGWRMGTRTEPAGSLPSLAGKEKPYEPKPDIYDEERLDFD